MALGMATVRARMTALATARIVFVQSRAQTVPDRIPEKSITVALAFQRWVLPLVGIVPRGSKGHVGYWPRPRSVASYP